MRSRSTLFTARAGPLFLSLPLLLGVVIALAAGTSGSARAGTGRGATAARAAGTWKLLPAAPVTKPAGEVSVWTGGEMIIHGVRTGKPGVTFAYRPASGTWATLRPGPASHSQEAVDVAVWTGSRMLVMGLTNGSYNPAANTWRPIAPLPLPDQGAVVAWTGHRALVWGGVCCAGSSSDGTAYDPKTNTWRMLPAAPLPPRRFAAGAWTGKVLIVAGGATPRPDHTLRLLRDAAAYNPVTRTWRKVAPMPLGRWDAKAVWDGKEILFLGGQTGEPGQLAVRGVAYNPATNRWRWLPKMAYPRSGFAAVWTGRQVLVWGGLTAANIPPPHGEAYTPATGKWTALPASPLRGRADPMAVWTGRQLIVWGGSGFTDGAAYTPAR